MAEKGIGLREELNKLDRANGGGGISKFISGVVTRSTRKWELRPLDRCQDEYFALHLVM